MATSDATYHTAEMVRALNEVEPTWWPRYECVYGELLVTPSPGSIHYWAAVRLFLALTRYAERCVPDALPMLAPADVSWGRDDVTVQPDVFVVPRAMARASWRERSWKAVRHLLLAVEVVSPSSRRADRFAKRQLYQRQGVPLYWILDPEGASAEVWTPEAHFPTIEREALVWRPEGATEALVLPLAELFAEP